MITVLTPTYNRAKKLPMAYKSLKQQTNRDFEWIVVDDGSSDNTKELITEYIEENLIPIRYIYKENGVKHTALNVGIKFAKGELLLILDSNDYLNDNSIELVNEYWDKYKNNPQICGITFLRKLKNPIYKDKLFAECISNPIEFKYNKRNLADMCELIRVDILKKYPYPVFAGETFLSEIIVPGTIAKKYSTAYVPIEIYNTEYLDDGLSKNWLKLVVNNPLGARINNLMFMSRDYKFSIRCKNCIMFDVFSIIAKESAIKENKMKFCATLFYIPSFLVAKILILI